MQKKANQRKASSKDYSNNKGVKMSNRLQANTHNNDKQSLNLISKDTVLADIVQDPKLYEVLAKAGVPCIVCPFMQTEMHFLTLEQICQMYNIDLKQLLKHLNQAYKQDE